MRNKLINRKNSSAPEKKLLLFTVAGILVVFVSLNIACIFIYDVVTQCDYFRAKSIKVSGTNHLLSKQVIKQAGLSLNQNILSINLNKAKFNVINNFWVEKALVKRKYPSTVVIKIVEHEPFAILSMDRKYIVNNKGAIFKEWEKGDPEDIPVIKGIDYRDISIGGKPGSFSYEQALGAVKAKIEYEKKFHQLKIKRIVTDREIGISVIPDGYKFSICMGFNNLPEKFDKLFYVIKYLKQSKKLDAIASININFLNRVIIKPASEKPYPYILKEV